ncbi:MAG: NADPH-dependent glutamate synthase [Candidatus Eisenbacteria bacterium]|nr:NADPH-dependent glutamate synthase [Candidatus Eisenbacteria bacterium]
MNSDKPKKKLILERQKMSRQDPLLRSKNFKEVALGYTDEEAVVEAVRCIDCKKPLCIDGCPVEIDIPGFIRLIQQRDFLGSARKLKEKNSLPAICGRVCPQEDQCEKVCLVGRKGDPIAIGRLERFAADYERRIGNVEVPKLPAPSGKRVAVVGSGPAGLTIASDLAKMGHDVTIFEALHSIGGVLRYGIPEFRLPKAVLEAEVDYLRKLGVKIEKSFVVGRLRLLDEFLMDGFDAVFVGTGAGLPYFMGVPGENLNGVYSANEFLTRVNLMKAYLFPDYDTPVVVGKKVAVIGAGNTAMDAARCALRLGAESHIIYRRSREEAPARKEEVENAQEEGVQFHFLAAPVDVLGTPDGWVRALRLIRMELGEPDDSGRRRPVPVKGSETEFDVQTVVVAVGQGPNPLVPSTTEKLEVNKKGCIVADPATGETTKKGVFAGGDIVTGGATVILAMGAARKAARAIDKYLEGEFEGKYWSPTASSSSALEQ